MIVRVAVEIRNGGRNQDRARYFLEPERAVLVLADGAGGFGDGAKAAERVVADAHSLFSGVLSSPAQALEAADIALANDGCLSTGVIVEIRRDQLSGASVGDSGAWLIHDGQIHDLTANQESKPLLGDRAQPISFGAVPLRGRLLLASDGLFKYASLDAIVAAAMDADLDVSAKMLVELPKLLSGDFPDDVSVVLAEV